MNPPAPTVLVVRPRAQALAWVAQLRRLGVSAQALPLIDILPGPDPASVVEVCLAVARLAAATRDEPASAVDAPAARIDGSTRPLLVFVSANAVSGWIDAVSAGATAAVPPAWPAQAWAAATGPGTVAALRAAGVPGPRIVAPPLDAGRFDSEALWARLGGWRWAGRRVWIVRGNGGRDWLAQRMREAGAVVEVVQSYARALPVPGGAERGLLAAALADPARWVWMFSSSEAIDNLQSLMPGADWSRSRALASHPRIAERAEALGFASPTVIVPSPAAVAAALDAAATPGS